MFDRRKLTIFLLAAAFLVAPNDSELLWAGEASEPSSKKMESTKTGVRQPAPSFSRHVLAIFSRAGCNGGTCHGAVQGKNGFRLSLFGADPAADFEQVVRGSRGRRVNPAAPEHSLLLLKASARVPHGGGKVLSDTSPEYALLRRWIAGGAKREDLQSGEVQSLRIEPAAQRVKLGEQYSLQVQATFADGTSEDVTPLCKFESLDPAVASVDKQGRVTPRAVGDAALVVRYRAEPATAMVIVPNERATPFPGVQPENFIDEHILAKLRRLNVPPAARADDATFLRRARLDVTGRLPSPEEVRAFLADPSPDKRTRKIEELLADSGHVDLWTMKFCDLLKASEFGVYADGLKLEDDAPRFQAWVRARLAENLPYDDFAARILTATSREGRSLDAWSEEVLRMVAGETRERRDLEIYRQRKTLDLYWQRADSQGVPGALQVAHTFLGLRLECAQCHRHPHDVWQQDDLLSFANFFARVRKPGFQGDNEKKYPEAATIANRLIEEGKQLAEEVKKLDGRRKELDQQIRDLSRERDKLRGEVAKLENEGNSDGLKQAQQRQADTEAKLAELEAEKAEIQDKQRRSKYLGGVVAKRILHADIFHVADEDLFASVKSPLGNHSSRSFRLLGESEPVMMPVDEDPRKKFVEWLRRPDNPYFARAIVNRVWAHYFGRGIVDPPDHLSPLNPASHPELLDELARRFVAAGYDLKWLHRTLLASRTYQQSSFAADADTVDRTNYASFYYRRLPAEVLLDAVNQATGTTENMDMHYYRWPDEMRTVQVPFMPRNTFVKFMLNQFGRPQRSSAVQCDCERDSEPSVLQVLSLANHPRVLEKIGASEGRITEILQGRQEPGGQIEEVFLATVSRPPEESEMAACLDYLQSAESPAAGLRGVMWSLLNTREFVLQH